MAPWCVYAALCHILIYEVCAKPTYRGIFNHGDYSPSSSESLYDMGNMGAFLTLGPSSEGYYTQQYNGEDFGVGYGASENRALHKDQVDHGPLCSLDALIQDQRGTSDGDWFHLLDGNPSEEGIDDTSQGSKSASSGKKTIRSGSSRKYIDPQEARKQSERNYLKMKENATRCWLLKDKDERFVLTNRLMELTGLKPKSASMHLLLNLDEHIERDLMSSDQESQQRAVHYTSFGLKDKIYSINEKKRMREGITFPDGSVIKISSMTLTRRRGLLSEEQNMWIRYKWNKQESDYCFIARLMGLGPRFKDDEYQQGMAGLMMPN